MSQVDEKEESGPSKIPHVYATGALLLGIAALPVSLQLASYVVGVFVAGVGVLLGLVAILSSISRRCSGLGIALLSLLVCGSLLYGTVKLGGGTKGLVQEVNARFGKSDPASQPVENKEETKSDAGQGTDADAGTAEPPGADATKGNGTSPTKRREEEDTVESKEAEPVKPTKTEPGKPVEPKEEEPAIPKKTVPGKPELTKLIAKLQSTEPKDRVQALQTLRRYGPDARLASRAVCSAALKGPREVRDAAIETLEKIHPDLAKLVTTCLVDEDSYRVTQAIRELAARREEANPAIPILIEYSKKRGSEGVDIVQALGAIGPTDPEAIRFIIKQAETPSTDSRRGRAETRRIAVAVLGTLTKNEGPLRREIITTLGKVMSECEEWRKNAKSRYVSHLVLLEAIKAIEEYGRDAKDAIPLLKRLKLDSSGDVRDAANAALRKIEADEE